MHNERLGGVFNLATILAGIFLLGLTTGVGQIAALADETEHTDSEPAVTSRNVMIVELEASKDNTLYDVVDGSLSNGIGEYIFAGKTLQPRLRRAVIAFDVKAGIPTASKIITATLDLHVSQTIAGNTLVALHRLQSNWGQGTSNALILGGGMGAPSTNGDATWLHTFYDNQFWATAGGDFVETSSATQIVGGEGFYTWGSTDRMVTDVQDWLFNPSTNFGWIIIGDEEASPPTAKRFDSRENQSVANRPLLTVAYEPLPNSLYLPVITK